ncbi:MAG: TerB family tellurite resistance protein [Phycisphaeraceae bacterium]
MPMKETAILRAACCVAGLDKQITQEEQKLLKQLAMKAGVGEASVQAMLDRAMNEPAYYEDHFKFVRTDPDRTMKAVFAVAVADGHLDVNERVILQHFAQRLGMEQERFDQLLRAAEQYVESRQTRGS